MNPLLNERHCLLLLEIGKNPGTKNLQDIGRKVYKTRANHNKAIELLGKSGLAYSKIQKKGVIPLLTEKGKKAVKLISDIITL